MRNGALNPVAEGTAALARTTRTRTGRAAPSGGGGLNGSSRYACTRMLPLRIDGSPPQTTVPLTLYPETPAGGIIVTACACEAA